MGENSLSGYGPIILMKRPVRIRMQGVVGAGGLKPPATRLDLWFLLSGTVDTPTTASYTINGNLLNMMIRKYFCQFNVSGIVSFSVIIAVP